MSILITLEILTTPVYNGVCIHIGPSIGELVLYFRVYCHFVYYRGRVYDHVGVYEGENLASSVACRLED